MTNYVKKMQTEKCQMDTNSQFIYETHLHTSEASACGSMKGADYIQKYKQCGYSGIFVTDHFCFIERSPLSFFCFRLILYPASDLV